MTTNSPTVFSLMKAAEVAAAAGGALLRGGHDVSFTGVSIDSRTLNAGELFVAIRGPLNDGHAFVGAAFARGAGGAIVDGEFEVCAGPGVVIRARDTHEALKDLSIEIRKRWKGSLVGITGSMGKTTTKEFCSQVLAAEYSVFRTPGNLNNLYGLPLSILGLGTDDRIGLFEMGMSAPGEIAELCRIARPFIGVLTNVAPVHLEFFKSVEAIAEAKAELVRALPPEGALVYNADDPLVRGIAATFEGEKTSFGVTQPADVRAEGVEIASLDETRFRLVLDGVARQATIPAAGLHYVMNALAATALAGRYRIPADRIVETLAHLRLGAMRGRTLRFQAGFTVIDDSYNSNPQALLGVLETLSRIPAAARRIVVAGEMLELGPAGESMHYACGRRAAESGIDVVIGVRGNARAIAQGARDGGLPAPRAQFFPDVDSAALHVVEMLGPGDLVLVKGSRGVRLDRLVAAIQARHAAA
jgi:UDP-N-acetylmuramoyl-tripeptide--D-alanyl-D-alanine ligase